MASPIKPEELETLGGGYALWGIYPQDKSRSRFWIESPEGLVVTKSYAWAFDARIEAVKAGYIPAEEAGFLPMQLCSTVRELLAGR